MNKELILKAKECKSAEELMVFAKKNGVELTEEQAKEYFAKINPENGEVADDELDNVAGGCDSLDQGVCQTCGSDKVKVKYLKDQNGYLREALVCANCETFWKWK